MTSTPQDSAYYFYKITYGSMGTKTLSFGNHLEPKMCILGTYKNNS